MLRTPDFTHAALPKTVNQAITAELAFALQLCADAVHDTPADVGDQDHQQIRQRNMNEEAEWSDGCGSTRRHDLEAYDQRYCAR
jgi:hypothetical protein